MASSPASSPSPPPAQRAWRSACPHCGAAVDFASAASVSAVCSYCRSTLLREGQALRRIGECAELFDDHSPLQLGVRGRYQGVAFTLVGRLQYAYEGGTWNEWHALFDPGEGRPQVAWLSEDNGAYVLAFELPVPPQAPTLAQLRPGLRHSVGLVMWSVASVQQVRVRAAQGELPHPPRLDEAFVVADLRNEVGEVGTLEGSDPAALRWAVGRSVDLPELALSGLREGEAERTLAAHALACPNCGAALAPRLSQTRSLTCPSCHSVVDISQGVGADLRHFAQLNQGAAPDEVAQPALPLGRTGRLVLEPGKPPQPWQVVGYMERCDLPGPEDEAQTFWREYLLYHRQRGFIFLVDTAEGWSWMRPLSGAPKVESGTLNWGGRRYRQRWSYRAKVTWVLGEFYWRVQREEQAHVTDYTGPSGWLLSCERTAQEVVWSVGRTLDADAVGQAFGLSDAERQALRRAAGAGPGWRRVVLRWMLLLAVGLAVVGLIRSCAEDDCRRERELFGPDSPEYQQCLTSRSTHARGSSYGGYSSGGGGHK